MSKSLKKLIDINRLREFKNKLVGTDSVYVQTAAVDQTIAGTKTFSKPIVGSVTGSSGSCTGNAATATRADSAANADTATNANYANSAGIAPSSDSVKGRGWLPNGVDMTTLTSGSYQCSPNNLPSQGVPYGTSTYGELLIACGSQYTSIIYIDVFGSSACWSSNQQAWVINVHSGNIGSQSVNYANSAASADTATNATYANWLRTSSHTDHLFHTEWDGAYFWTYVTASDGGYRPVRVARSDSATTADSVPSSAIRAQWYAAYPDGAEAHNAMWGGRDITAAFDSGEFSANIANGTFRDIFPGDYITKQVTISGTAYTVNWVIADCDYWWHKGDQNSDMQTHHVVIVPQQPIFDAQMNATNTTEGGYAGSRMYRETIPACATGIVNAFGSGHILKFRDGISNRVDTGAVSSGVTQWTGASGWWGEWVDAYCNLMSEKMVYDAPITASGAMDNTVALRQMSAFRLSERLINYNRSHWWLRDVVSSAYFAIVSGYGSASSNDASDVTGVRPFALLV